MTSEQAKERILEAAREIIDALDETEFTEACRAMRAVLDHFNLGREEA